MKFELTTSIMEQVVNQKEKPKKKKKELQSYMKQLSLTQW